MLEFYEPLLNLSDPEHHNTMTDASSIIPMGLIIQQEVSMSENDMETCLCARKVTQKEYRMSRRRFVVHTITRMKNGLILLNW